MWLCIRVLFVLPYLSMKEHRGQMWWWMWQPKRFKATGTQVTLNPLSHPSQAASGESTVNRELLSQQPSKPSNRNMSSFCCWRHLSLTDLGLNDQLFDLSPFALSRLTRVYMANENPRLIYSKPPDSSILWRSGWCDRLRKLLVIWPTRWGSKFLKNSLKTSQHNLVHLSWDRKSTSAFVATRSFISATFSVAVWKRSPLMWFVPCSRLLTHRHRYWVIVFLL